MGWSTSGFVCSQWVAVGLQQRGLDDAVDRDEQLHRALGAQRLLQPGFQRGVGRHVEVVRRVAQLGDPLLQPLRVLRVQPDVQAEGVLHLPLGRRGELRQEQVRQPRLDPVVALQPADVLLDAETGLAHLGRGADAAQLGRPERGWLGVAGVWCFPLCLPFRSNLESWLPLVEPPGGVTLFATRILMQFGRMRKQNSRQDFSRPR